MCQRPGAKCHGDVVGEGSHHGGNSTLRRTAARRRPSQYDELESAPTEPFVAGPGESRVIRDRVLQAELAEPAIDQINLDLPTQLALGADREGIAYDEHPDHQFRVDRGPADPRVVGRQFGTHPRQVEYCSDLANQMVLRDHVLEPELVEQLTLVPFAPTHHRAAPSAIVVQQTESRSAPGFNRVLQHYLPFPDILTMPSTCFGLTSLRGVPFRVWSASLLVASGSPRGSDSLHVSGVARPAARKRASPPVVLPSGAAPYRVAWRSAPVRS